MGETIGLLEPMNFTDTGGALFFLSGGVLVTCKEFFCSISMNVAFVFSGEFRVLQ